MKKVSLKLSSILLAGGLLLLTSCGEDSSTTEVRTSENTALLNILWSEV